MNKVVIIGAGNVATHLATALQNARYDIVQIFSRTTQAAQTLSATLHTVFTTEIENITKNADFYIYCVSDSSLEEVINRFDYSAGLHIHTAGSISSQVFEGKRENYGVIYPLQTFSKQKKVDFNSVPLFVEANNEQNLGLVKEIAGKISERLYEISSEKRMKMHISAVFACNFSNYMYQIAAELLNESDLPFDLMLPLIEESIAKLNSLSPYQAQTGPAVRNDQNVISKHLQTLSYNPDIQYIYKLLTKAIIKNHSEQTK